MIGDIEHTVLEMKDKLVIYHIGGFTMLRYPVNDPYRFLQTELFALRGALDFSVTALSNPGGLSLIGKRYLEFTIYDEDRIFELSKEKSDVAKELAVVWQLHNQKDLTLTFRNLFIQEPFFIKTNVSSMGSEGYEHSVNCKFINCIFEETDFKNCHDVGRIEIEDCIAKNTVMK